MVDSRQKHARKACQRETTEFMVSEKQRAGEEPEKRAQSADIFPL